VLLAPINSCELHIIDPVLSCLRMDIRVAAVCVYRCVFLIKRIGPYKQPSYDEYADAILRVERSEGEGEDRPP